MTEAYCGTDKADYSEQDKNCFNRELEMTVSRAEYFLEEMEETNLFIKDSNIPLFIEDLLIDMIAEKTSKAREVIKELNKAMIK